jgi:hypothetical protein
MITGKPILSLGSAQDSSIGEVIAETGTGVVCSDQEQLIEAVLLQALQGNYSKIYQPNIEVISKFNRKIQASELLELVNNLHKRSLIGL